MTDDHQADLPPDSGQLSRLLSADAVAEALNRVIDKTAAEDGTPGLMRLFDRCFSEWFSHNQPEHSQFPGLLTTEILDTHLAIEKPSMSN